MAFGRHTTTRPGTDPEVQGIITDALSSDAAALEREAGPIGRAFIAAVDKAVHLQSGPIRAYVDWVRRQNPDATPAQVQEIMDKHFRNAVTGTGAGAGAAAAVPGIGLITGAAAVAGESVLFLDIAAFYTVASAYLRGVEISDPERRRAIVLVALTGSKGLAVVDTLLGENTKKLPTAATLSRFSGPTLVEANNILTRAALKQVRRKISKAWIGKLLPLGLGALAGVGANRKLAAAIVDNVSPSLGPIPAHFSSELPAKSDGSLKDALSPRTFLDFVNKAFGRDGRDGSEAAEAPQPEEGKKGLFRRKK
ncbi:hypothetical protein [Corynebacterium senegalense]|uniref:hypothetical protein n=1 Tax=Corynebacterium senegalense TaxID=2080750 RepID=UPI0015F25365|nr:hypothetical protein [Corynebacterium senegalense]